MTSAALLEQKFVLAFAAHKAAQWDKATALYREILQSAPKHFDTLHLLGVVYLQTGKYEEARRLLAKATSINPREAVALRNLGNVFQALGRHEEALKSFGESLFIKPDSAEALKSSGDSEQALGRHAQALDFYSEALRVEPKHAEVYNNQGISLYALGRHTEALASYDRAITLKPQYAAAYNNRGDALRFLNRVDDALASYTQAVSLEPGLIEARVNRGAMLRLMLRYDEALEAFDDALKINPNNVKALNNRGALLRDKHRYAEAIGSFNKALALHPAYVEALVNLASTLRESGQYGEALKYYDKALALDPEHPEAHMNKGLALLAAQQWDDGWAAYERRWQCKDFKFIPRPFSAPPWRGEHLGNGVLLVLGEQGIGDEVLYAAMIGDLLRQGKKIVWETDPRLVSLFARSFPDVTVVARTTPPNPATTPADVVAQVPIGSLGQFMRRNPEDFSKSGGYLTVDRDRSTHYRRRLLQDGKTSVIGLSWASSNPEFGGRKSISLGELAPLWQAAGKNTCFVDLQYGNTREERTDASLALTHLEDLDLYNDLDGAAALIAACDRVITVSNTTAHLAGALAVPVDVMISEGSGKLWYWGMSASSSPWYPSATIYRQPALNAWEPVVENIARNLTSRI